MWRRPERSRVDVGRGGSRGAWPGRLAVLAVVLVMVSLVLSYAARVVLDRQQFADRAVATLKSLAVRDDVADHLTQAAVRYGGQDLTGVRPVIRAIAGTIVSSGAFQSLFRRAVLEIHSTMVQGRPGPILVNVSDSGVLLQAALERFAPEVATRLGAQRTARLGELRPGGVVLTVIHTARRVATIAWVLALLALIAGGVALWLAEDRRGLLERLGIGFALSGVAIAAVYVIGGTVATQAAVAGRGAVVAALWRAFAHGLLVQALVVAGAGVVLAAVAGATRAHGARTAGVTRRSGPGSPGHCWRSCAGLRSCSSPARFSRCWLPWPAWYWWQSACASSFRRPMLLPPARGRVGAGSGERSSAPPVRRWPAPGWSPRSCCCYRDGRREGGRDSGLV